MDNGWLLSLVLTVITSGTLTALVTSWMNRHKTRAEAVSIEEQADATSIGSLLHVIETLQAQYDALARRVDEEHGRWQAATAETVTLRSEMQRLKDDADRANNNLRDELAAEKKQRQAQSDLIIQLSDKVTEMQGVIEAQAAVISSLRADLTESERKRTELKRDLENERRARLLLAGQLEIIQKK